jgi:hypothetical protein
VAAEVAQVLGDERGLPLPRLGVDREQEAEVAFIDVPSIGIQGATGRPASSLRNQLTK